MNSYKKLVNNSVVFAFGTLGSKVIQFLLVPLYTYYLSTTQYGRVDVITTSINLMIPFTSASIFDAVLRFVMDKKYSQEKIISNSLAIAFIGLLFPLLLLPFLKLLNPDVTTNIIIFLLLAIQIFERILAQYTRGLGKVKVFAFNGMLLTFSIGMFNIVFLVLLGWGIKGYFLSVLLANTISVLYLFFASMAYKSVSIVLFDFSLIRSMISYSLPLIPNSLMWWLINASSRYFIGFFVGLQANGLFSVASKIPSLVAIINQIFQQAWQMSAIEEYDSKDKSVFYSNVFNLLSTIMLLGSSFLIIFIKPMFQYLFSNAYFDAWKVVPFLLLSSVFSTFSGFLGTNYIASKKTHGVFKTSVYGGLGSIFLNFILIPKFGIMGAGISSMLSFLIMWMIRLYDTREIVTIVTDWKNIITTLIFISMQIAVLYFEWSSMNTFYVVSFLFVIVCIYNMNFFKLVISTFNKTAKNK